MRGRTMVVLLLVAASFTAVAASADLAPNINEQPTGRKLSECYTCHKDGGGAYGPAMTDTYLIISPQTTIVPVGEKVEFLIGVQNAWTAETDRIVASVDLSNATGLAHASAKADIQEVINDAVAVTGSIADQIGGSETDYKQRVTFNVEGGVTDLVLTLEPTHAQEALQPQIGLRLWPSNQDASRRVDPNLQFTANAKGESLVVAFSGASNIVELGVGEWVAEVFVDDAFTSQDPSGLVDQPFRLTIDQLFLESEDPVAFGGSDATLPDVRDDPGFVAEIPFILTTRDLPDGPGTVTITVNAREFYDHPASISSWDQWVFTKSIDLVVAPVDGQDAVQITGVLVEAPTLTEGIAWDRIGEVIGYVSSFLILASIYTGGMFGKSTRRQLNSVFGTAKRRVAFHNFLSYGILSAAVVHTFMFIFVEAAFAWTKGLIWGGVAILAMIGLGVTGAMQVPMIRKWNYAVWRWSHFYLAIATMVFTVVHILLDGQNFADFQAALGYSDPLD